MPDGGTTVIIQGKKRFQMLALVEEEPYFKARDKCLLTMINYRMKILMHTPHQ
jgi:hypothetical protein